MIKQSSSRKDFTVSRKSPAVYEKKYSNITKFLKQRAKSLKQRL